MLLLFLSFFVYLLVFSGIGAIIENVTQEKSNLSLKILKGIITVTVFWTFLSFFIPLSIYVESATVSIGIIAFFALKEHQKVFNFFFKNPGVFLVILLAAFFGSFYPYILDHFGYYVPTIKWISEFGIVKGNSNLDLTLGQMSFWHVLQAGFSHVTDSFLRLNSFFLLPYLLYIFEKKSWLHFVFLPVLFLFVQQPNPDLPVIVFSLIILNEVLDGNRNLKLLFLLSAFVFAIKPTAIWLPLLCLFSLKNLKEIKNFIPGMAVLLLFFFKNIWTFGYPVFPVQMFDLGISWKPNAELLQNSAQLAIEKTYDLQFTFNEINNFSTFEYIKNWLFLDGLKGIINTLFILSLIALIVFAFIKRRTIIWLICFAILIKSISVLLFSAQYRFFLEVFFAVFFLIFYQKFSKTKSIAVFIIGTFFIGMILIFPKLIQTQIPSFNLGFAMGKFKAKQLYKPAEYHYSKFKTYQIGNLRFNAVENYPFSFETPLPAITPAFILEYYHAGIFPQMKTSKIADGFIWKKLTDVEKEQVKNILIDLKFDPKINYYKDQK